MGSADEEFLNSVDDTEVISVIWNPQGVTVDHQGVDMDTALALLLKGAIWLVLDEMGFTDEDDDDEDEPVEE